MSSSSDTSGPIWPDPRTNYTLPMPLHGFDKCLDKPCERTDGQPSHATGTLRCNSSEFIRESERDGDEFFDDFTVLIPVSHPSVVFHCTSGHTC